MERSRHSCSDIEQLRVMVVLAMMAESNGLPVFVHADSAWRKHVAHHCPPSALYATSLCYFSVYHLTHAVKARAKDKPYSRLDS